MNTSFVSVEIYIFRRTLHSFRLRPIVSVLYRGHGTLASVDIYRHRTYVSIRKGRACAGFRELTFVYVAAFNGASAVNFQHGPKDSQEIVVRGTIIPEWTNGSASKQLRGWERQISFTVGDWILLVANKTEILYFRMAVSAIFALQARSCFATSPQAYKPHLCSTLFPMAGALAAQYVNRLRESVPSFSMERDAVIIDLMAQETRTSNPHPKPGTSSKLGLLHLMYW